MLVPIQRLKEAEALSTLKPYDEDDQNTTSWMFLDIDDNDTLKGLFYDSGDPSLKVVRPLSLGGSSSSVIYKHKVVMDKSVVNDLHNTSIVVTPNDLGLSAGQYAPIFSPNFEIIVDTDGINFNAGANRIELDTGGGTTPKVILSGNIDTDQETNFPQQITENLIPDPSYTISATGQITGGGVNSSITLNIYYRKLII